MIRSRPVAGTWRAACLVLLAFLFTACTTYSDRPLEPIGDLGALRSSALQLVNQERTRRGLPAVRMSARLNAAAQAHAEDMARRDYYRHRSPEGQDVADRYRANGGGLWYTISENIHTCVSCEPASQQLRKFQAGWMKSAGHRRNILDPRVREFGFGMAAGGGRYYAVQAFVTERDAVAGPAAVR